MVSEAEHGAFLELLYGAAIEQGDWVRVIATFADLIGGARVWMPDISLANGSGAGVIARIDPAAQKTYFQHYATRNPFVKPTIGNPGGAWPLNVRTDEDEFAKEDLVRTEYFNDFLRPQDIHSCLIVRLGRRDGMQSTINVSRPRHREQFGGADLDLARRLHPDLIRAFNLSRKFADLGAFAAGMAETLERSLHGVLLLDDTGRVLHANTVAERLVREGDGLRIAAGRLGAWPGEAARQLEALIGRAGGRDGACRLGGSMALPTPSRMLPLSITVAPLRAERLLATASPAVLVCVTDLEAGVSLPAQQLGDLFGLTPAECRVALAMFEGATLREAAAQFGVSVHTVHAQVARIFEKTGTTRQAELIGLMVRLAV
jgi:DNA-binding CsgD family transcriptional regulator